MVLQLLLETASMFVVLAFPRGNLQNREAQL